MSKPNTQEEEVMSGVSKPNASETDVSPAASKLLDTQEENMSTAIIKPDTKY